jgi:hypothetical protein
MRVTEGPQPEGSPAHMVTVRHRDRPAVPTADGSVSPLR